MGNASNESFFSEQAVQIAKNEQNLRDMFSQLVP